MSCNLFHLLHYSGCSFVCLCLFQLTPLFPFQLSSGTLSSALFYSLKWMKFSILMARSRTPPTYNTIWFTLTLEHKDTEGGYIFCGSCCKVIKSQMISNSGHQEGQTNHADHFVQHHVYCCHGTFWPPFTLSISLMWMYYFVSMPTWKKSGRTLFKTESIHKPLNSSHSSFLHSSWVVSILPDYCMPSNYSSQYYVHF